jgi:aminoglycoside 6'-N-acetyltransferase I
MGTASHKRSHRVPKERTWDELIVQALPSKRPHSSLSPPDGPVPYMATPETNFTIAGGWWHGTSECSNVKVRITNLETSDESLVRDIATMLVTGFREKAPEAYPTLTTARAEVCESFAPDRISLVAVDNQGTAVGWIGGIKHYRGHAWELHPLVVRPDQQRRGIGRRLVCALERRVLELGGRTIYLGTDDEQNQTSIGGIDLYPNVWEHVRNITNLRDHPYEFYQKLGYVIVGAIPDANGFGKPDIFMAKRLKP